MEEELAATKIKRPLKHKTPYVTDHAYQPVDSVLAWRDNIVNSRIGEFMEPFTNLVFDPQSRIVV